MSCALSTSSAPTTTSSDSRPSVELRACTVCKKLKVPIMLKFKLCNDCREKSRKATKKMRDNRKVLGAFNKEQVADSSKLGRVGQPFISSVSMQDMVCTEYQTSSELFGALKFLSASTSPLSNPIQFHGAYTIVSASDVDNFQRVWLLATELNSKAWLSFWFKQPLSLIGDESSQTFCFACTCVEVLVTPAPASTVPNRNDENVDVTSTNNSFMTPRVCGGLITLKSLVDKTHPLGIPGQHIVVRVEHPLIGPHLPHGRPHMSKM